jgi:FKBP-type peptidyl-prolyl cis-trans isomerase 2
MRRMCGGIAGLVVAASLAGAASAPAQEPAPAVVATGRRVSIEYTLRLEDGTVADTNAGGKPLVYEHGAGELLPGLERALEGMAVGESKRGTLEPEAAYGAIDARLFVEVDVARIPEADRKVGARLVYRDEYGESKLVRVHELRGDRVVVDMNHPYAGSTVAYEVKVVAIE